MAGVSSRSTVVLTAYPLSHDFRARLEETTPRELEYLNVPQLRRLGTRALVSHARGGCAAAAA